MFKVLMPRVDAGMREGTIVEWVKKEGETVQKGDLLVTVEGEKAVFDIEAEASGVLSRILARKSAVVSVGEPIAVITELGEKPPEEEFESGREGRVLATPAAKRMARERGINLTKVRGSGPQGMIKETDLLQESETKALKVGGLESLAELEVSEIIPVVGTRKIIAERLTRSYRTAPQVAITMEADMSKALRMLQKDSETKGVGIPITALLATVVAKALKNNPIMNSVFDDDRIRVIKDINIGIAVALEDGLIVPVLHNADKKTISETAELMKELVDKSKTRSLSVEELKGGTFTISNLGGCGVEVFTPIINPPQAAILGVGRISEKPVVSNMQVQIASMMTLTLVFDHRIVDGAKAARFLQEIKELLETNDTMSY